MARGDDHSWPLLVGRVDARNLRQSSVLREVPASATDVSRESVTAELVLAMPIKPENKARYPKHWKAIVAQVRERSGGQCECLGECGLHRTNPGPRRCCERNGHPAKWAKGKVVLTVAHLDHTPENCELENLRDMCQRCHLRYDVPHHRATARKTRDARSGQQPLSL